MTFDKHNRLLRLLGRLRIPYGLRIIRIHVHELGSLKVMFDGRVTQAVYLHVVDVEVVQVVKMTS